MHALRVSRWAGLVSIALALGCVPTAVAPGKQAPGPDDGVVVVSLTANTARVPGFDTIYIRKEGSPGDNRVFFNQVSKGLTRDTTLFVGVVPAGEYTIGGLFGGARGAEKSVELGEGARTVLGRFRVKAGGAHDLGRLVLTGVNQRVVLGRSARVASNIDLVRRFAPENARFLAGEVDAGWLQPRSADDRVEEAALALPVGAETLAVLPSGELIAASRVGSLLVRDPKGRWSVLNSDVLESLFGVRVVQAKGLRAVAVGELNTILALEESGRLRKVDPGNLPPGNLVYVDGTDQDGWAVLHQAGKAVTVYRSTALESGDWKPLKTFTASVPAMPEEQQFAAWPTADGFTFAVYDGGVAAYERRAGAVVDRSAPVSKGNFMRIAPCGDAGVGALVAPNGGRGMFAASFVTRDDGRTWEMINSAFRVKIAAPRLLPDGRMLQPGGAFSGPNGELKSSVDGGKTWELVYKGYSPLDELVPIPGVGLFAVGSGLTSFGISYIQFSGDGGKTWTTEYSNVIQDAKK